MLDRKDGRIKPFFMPHTIYKLIEGFQENPEYAFDEVPMPYDVTIGAKKAGTKEVEYTVVPARQNTPLTVDELKALEAEKPLREMQKMLNEDSAAEPAAKPADGRLVGEPDFMFNPSDPGPQEPLA